MPHATGTAISDDARLSEWAGRGGAPPDHVIRTKARPLVLPPLPSGGDGPALAAWGRSLEQALEAYTADYRIDTRGLHFTAPLPAGRVHRVSAAALRPLAAAVIEWM